MSTPSFSRARPQRADLRLPTAALSALALATSAMPASADPDIAGAWSRYPRPSDKAPDPRYLAPRSEEPELKAPYAAAYAELRRRQRESDARGEPLANASTECLPDGMPTMMRAIYPLEILQTPGRVTIIEEANAQVRRIYLDEKAPAAADTPPGYFGYSVGRWEGDTLVVQTVGIKDTVRYLDLPHTANERITERIRLLSPDFLQDAITIDDPDRLLKPYSFTVNYARMPGYKMLEYVCDDNRTYIDASGVARMRIDPPAK